MIRYIALFIVLFAAATAMADRPKNNLLPAEQRHSMNFVKFTSQGNDLAPGVDPASVPPQPTYSAPPVAVYGNAAGCAGAPATYSGCSGSSSGCSGSNASGCSGSYEGRASGGRRLFGSFRRLFRARGCS